MKSILKLMSIVLALNSFMASGEDGKNFGKVFADLKEIDIGRSNDAAVENNKLYVIARGSLYVFDISAPGKPKKISRLRGLGMTRQIVVKNKIAYITSREDGFFIVDVSKPEKTKILCHYDSIELATGVDVAGNVAFVACRNYGVELIDVSDPTNPRHLSTARTGEAQSIIYGDDGNLYVGVWGESELVICDVKNPQKPKVISKTKLDGYGDGVWKEGKYCFVATGHHSRSGPKNDRHGRGHGLEIFDVSNPADPQFVSRIKAPRYYKIGLDMWDVKVVGKYAFLSDTWNGFFVIDISDIRKPFFVGHTELPKVSYKKQKESAPVCGFALAKGYVYLAGGMSDLYSLKVPMAKPVNKNISSGPVIPKANTQDEDKRFRVYKPDGQVYAAAFSGDTAIVAAGKAGIHLVKLWPEINKMNHYKTEGFCLDVKVQGDYVYAAEGKGGLSIWKLSKNKEELNPVGRYKVKNFAIKQVVVPPPGKYALLQIAAYKLHIVDISNPEKPFLAFSDQRLGLLYGYQITNGLLKNRYASCFWHVSGIFWYDLNAKPKPVYTGDNNPYRIGNDNGVAIYKDKCLVTNRTGRYYLFDKSESAPAKTLKSYGVKGKRLTGKPSIYGNTLYLSNRTYGDVSIVNISNVHKPELIKHFKLKGNPGIIVEHKGIPVIPAGYQGLLVLKK